MAAIQKSLEELYLELVDILRYSDDGSLYSDHTADIAIMIADLKRLFADET